MDSEDTNGILDYPVTPTQPVGIYGWRKRCIYAFVLILMVVVIINLALTVWILRVLGFSLDGMSRLKIAPNGFELKGEAEFLKPVYANNILSEKDNPLYVQSQEAIEIMAVDENKTKASSSVRIDHQGIHATCDVFKVEGSDGQTNLLLQGGQLTFANSDVIQGNVNFNGSVSTPGIRSPMGKSLTLMSESSYVSIDGTAGVVLDGGEDSGYVHVKAGAGGIRLQSRASIRLASRRMIIQNLPVSSPTSPAYSYNHLAYSQTSSVPQVFQLCICENGRLFLGLPSGDCRASSNTCNSETP